MSISRRALSLLVCVVAVTAAAPAAQRPVTDRSWRQIVTPDLVVAGNAPTGELKRMLREVTRFRGAFAQLFPTMIVESPVPTWVILLRDFQAFERFQPRDSRGKRLLTGGYFARGADVNFIVMPVSREEYALETIFHEYTHYILSRNVRTAMPTWLSEGVAEYYSTFRGDDRGDRTLIGAVPASSARRLQSSTFVPLRDIVSPRDFESMWRSEQRIGMFYAESWALVHYIVLGRKNPTPNPLDAYLKAFARTGDHDRAFTEAFGTDVEGMDKELRPYVRRLTLPAMMYDVQAEKRIADDAEPMLAADVNALEGRLLLDAGALEDAERELTPLVKGQPAHAGGQIALARLRLAQDRDDEAITSLQQVVATNPEHGPARYYLGTALERAWRHEEALTMFAKAIDLMPRNPAPWSGLNSAAIGLRRDAQANAALQNAMQIEWSPPYYWSQALHALRLGRNDVAAASVTRYLELRGIGEDQSVYPWFVQAIALWRAGRAADAEAALKLVEQADIDEWTRSVLQYLQGRLDETQFLRAADDIGEQTEAHTYIGFKIALEGREDEALAHFRWVAERGAKTYLEHDLARSELNRLQYRSTALAGK
jgi:tetratricopeptide (TPR) repeat protein